MILRGMRKRVALALAIATLSSADAAEGEPKAAPYPPTTLAHGALSLVHEFHGAMPTGVTVSRAGRVFVSYPRWQDPITFTVAELKGGKEVPYPSAELNAGNTPDQLSSVQSVVVGPDDRLWALDTGSIDLKPIQGQGWPKLVAIDLATDKVVQTIRFPPEVVRKESYLNDVRFDLRRGAKGMAFITDSASNGENGIVVVDLATGRSWRKLDGHDSATGDLTFVATMEGKPLLLRPEETSIPKPARVGSDGIAIEAGGERLFFCPLASRELYSVSLDVLADERSAPEQVEATLKREERKFASDGLEADAQGRLYLTDWEHNAIIVRTGEHRYETLVADPRLWWPDTLALSRDGHLYVIANQLHRQRKFHGGNELRKRPFQLFRVKVEGATPVRLTR